MNIKKNIMISLKLIVVGMIVFSVIYPLLLGSVGQIWRNKAKGSLIEYNGEVVGSTLIGQIFDESQYFRSRPSSISYNANKSSSANLAPNNPLLKERIKKDLIEINNRYGINKESIPADFVTESGSALDPHISPESAYIQVDAIAKATGLDKKTIEKLIQEHTQNNLFGIYGEKRVNVFKLNLSLKEVINK